MASNPTANHVFTCSDCARPWTVNSNDQLECFFVGLCYWCIRKHQISKDRIDQCLRSLCSRVSAGGVVATVDAMAVAKEWFRRTNANVPMAEVEALATLIAEVIDHDQRR